MYLPISFVFQQFFSLSHKLVQNGHFFITIPTYDENLHKTRAQEQRGIQETS